MSTEEFLKFFPETVLVSLEWHLIGSADACTPREFSTKVELRLKMN